MIKLTVHKATGFKKITGLIGRSAPEPVLLQTRFGIHTFGVRFPIDVLILDRYNRVVSLKKSLKPNRIFIWHPKYKTVIELPENTIKQKHIVIGTEI